MSRSSPPMRMLSKQEREKILPALVETGVACRSTCRRAVDQCRLNRYTPSSFAIGGPKTALAFLALRSRASGITLGVDVYVRSEFFDSEARIPMRLLAHEVAHVAQFLRDGRMQFLCRYLVDYCLGLAAGRGDRRAYLDICYEREARRVAEHVAPVAN